MKAPFSLSLSLFSTVLFSTALALEPAQAESRIKSLDDVESITLNGVEYLNKQQVLELLRQPANTSASTAVESGKSSAEAARAPGVAAKQADWRCNLKPPFSDAYFQASATARHMAINEVVGACMESLSDAMQCKESRVQCYQE
ncbi:hypothetical protein [Oceanobacter mangrovi]|uniref:hypothetical protein n=1 Tax=Oceanobacter mangrovi TaxID=2862510 RepID=UPI001C8DFA52|nr:hypothetical protein [Oceanobacter mangrovi]